MNIFDVVNDNFFSLLSSKNKGLYSECILRAFQIYETGPILGIDKKIIVDDLTNYLTERDMALDLSEEKDSGSDYDLENYDAKSYRQTANYILRRMEECGWIYTDITNDYVEILNFFDYAITVVEALITFEPDNFYYDYDNDSFIQFEEDNVSNFRGYIFTIYVLLTSKNSDDYKYIIREVYKNTKLLMRSLRKLDSRLKEYITKVVDTVEIKDLISMLFQYKKELVDGTYQMLKTSDNINKYQLGIVDKLESYIGDDYIMGRIVDTYLDKKIPFDKAQERAFREVNELIDIFNELDDFITEIDVKNKTYINTTIGKIKFLLQEDDNTIGKLNAIMKYVKNENKTGHIDRAISKISPIYNMTNIKGYNNEKSTFTPRGKYVHNFNQIIDTSTLNFDLFNSDIRHQFRDSYDERAISKFIKDNLAETGYLKGSDLINFNSTALEVLNILFCLIYACEKNFTVIKLDNNIENIKFSLPDFIIKGE